MFEDHNAIIKTILIESGSATLDSLDNLHDEVVLTGKSLAAIAIDEGMMTRSDLLRHIAEYLHSPYRDADSLKVPPEEILRMIPATRARMNGVVPIGLADGALEIVAADPFNTHVVDELEHSLNLSIKLVITDPEGVSTLLQKAYGEEDLSLSNLLDTIQDRVSEKALKDGISEKEISEMAQDTPIIRFVDLVLSQAIREKASDIHFEPFEDTFRIRYRVDGALYDMTPPPLAMALPVISRIKILSNMNIAERRIPQDGRLKMTIAGRAIDIRVSTLPTQFGESVVLRVLDKSIVNLDLDQLGMPDHVLKAVRATVARPNGIFIVTGPTGSGKTTTLYSALREINSTTVKILTAEDPVEYEIDGIMQVPMNHQVGLDFSYALRSFLRQDPDKIMVGEIRDLETARIAVQASLTGHTVFSTLHTNDAAGAITRLIDMGLEPYLLAASLQMVLAQRLVRRICRNCRAATRPTRDLIRLMKLENVNLDNISFYYGRGCQNCNGKGFRSRQGLFEMLQITESLRESISRNASLVKIREMAIKQGMTTLREDGIRAVLDGLTTAEEMLKYT